MRASTIDGLAVSALVWILSAFLPDAGLVGSALLGLAVSALYGIVPVCGPWRATPGKRIAGIMVERMDGDALGPPLAAGRWAAGWLSWLPFCLGYLPILAGADKATLHDSMCGTRVVAGRAEDVS